MSKVRTIGTGLVVSILVAGISFFLVRNVFSHCDTTSGPVILEAKAALEKGDVTPILKWIKKDNEAEIKAAFTKAVAVRAKGPEAKELADQYFLETLVRLHRAGEGAPYTGIKDEPVEPPVAAADKAIADGNVDDLAKKIGQAAEKSVRERFERLIKAKKHKDESVEAGREYVEAYVIFVHYVEGLHNTITQSGAHDEHASEKRDEGHGH